MLLLVLALPVIADAQTGLQFNGTNQHVTFGNSPTLNASSFTIECWLMRTGTSANTSTGTGGWAAIAPLVTKGRGEAESPANLNMNWFLGIRSDSVLCADFEEATGPNRPLGGTRALRSNLWYHAAVTYDVATGRYRLYLNGQIEKDTTLAPGTAPASTSVQHAGLATAMTSTGATAGFFNGRLDEVRVWNVARTQSEIQADLGSELTSGTGLIARWGLNDGAGTSAANSVAGSANGTLVNGPSWVGGSTFSTNYALDFLGTNGVATFGNPPELGLPVFTIECWFRRDGAGTSTNTGTGGAFTIPLLAHGRGDQDTGLVLVNWLLGIRESDGVLMADFEEGPTGSSPQQNHPVFGVTPIAPGGGWHHGAATYDGTTWKLYLDGNLEGTVVVNEPAGTPTVMPASIGSALNTAGTADGFFDGVIDEARVWSVARTQLEIQGDVNDEIAGPTADLVARWGMNEGAGNTIASSAGTPLTGALSATGWTWTAGAPFDLVVGPPSPPADPSALAATALTSTRIQLGWTDGSNNETGFEIERSTTGPGGAFTPRVTVGANVTSWTDSLLTPTAEYCYRVRAVNLVGSSGYTNVDCETTPAVSRFALDLSGGAYVTFGDADPVDLPQFTIECWFRRDGAGTTTTTGTGGVADAIPLVTNGRGEAETSNVDLNWFLGIRASDGVLAADFEEGAGGTNPSLNHPVVGVTPIPADGTWHHAAATYDGTTWNLYLDGLLENTLVVGQPVASASTQHAAIGSALTSTGAAAGSFDGAFDEVRVWSTARTIGEIQGTANAELDAATPGLVARWSLDEGAGTVVAGSAGTAVNGSISGAGYAWVGPAPFDLSFGPPTPPDAPDGLAANALSAGTIRLTWNDLSNNETRFEIERSATGAGGPFAWIANVSANVTQYDDGGRAPETEYCYRVRAANTAGASGYTDVDCATTPASVGGALDLSGGTYVTFGDADPVDLPAFTVECWFRRDGTGTVASSGSGGVSGIPLVTNGRGESENSNVDLNWFLGIRGSDNVLAADFEEGAAGASPGLNHPVFGVTPVPADGTWHHAAMTYDGTTWNLYLDGNLEATLAVGQPVASASTQHAALGTALNSTGVPEGAFDGAFDEVRVWNFARTIEQIRGAANAEIDAATTGLVARWSLDEGAGTTVGGSAGTSVNGTITGAGYAWIAGAPFDLAFNDPPAVPALVGPPDGGAGVPVSTPLRVAVSDPDADSVTVTFHGRVAGGSPGPDFTLIPIPDTQYYTGQLNGGTNAMLKNQLDWIVANRVSRNIVYAVQLGDCVEHGQNGDNIPNNPIEWMRADTSFSKLEDPGTTGLPHGIPYGICAGNHDQTPIGDADGSTAFYNQYFGIARFQGRPYYGGPHRGSNDNWFDLFSASGYDFMCIGFEYDTTPDAAVLDWADSLMKAYPGRRAIVASHNIGSTGNPATFSTQGSAIYTALRDNPNFFLMLAGHVPGEGRRQDVFEGRTVHTVISDYQSRTNGGNGWLRIMEFSPANNVIRVRTYSPWLNQFEADADSSSQFTLAYDMGGSATPFTAIGSVKVASGETAELAWPGLAGETEHEWYAVASDGAASRTGPTWSFTTAEAVAPEVTVLSPNGGEAVGVNQQLDVTWTATDNVGVVSVDVLLSRAGASGPWETIASGVANSGTIGWTVTGPATTDAWVRVVAHDAAANSGADVSDGAFTISSTVGVGGGASLEFALGAVTPNPSRGEMHVPFALPAVAAVRVRVFDAQGREVAVLADRTFPAGRHDLTWNGRGRASAAPSGVYFVRLDSPGRRALVRRVALIR